MADTPEAVASRLHEFVEAVKHKVAGAGGQTQVHSGPGAKPSFAPKDALGIYRECLNRLGDHDRTKLRELIDAMQSALEDPQGPLGAATWQSGI